MKLVIPFFRLAVFSAPPRLRVMLWLFAFLLLPSTFVAAAATVTGTVRDSAGTLYTGTVSFIPDTLQRVRVIGADLLAPTTVTATATNGVVTATLREGNYYVGIGAAKQFRIAVGAADGEFDLLDLIVGGTDNTLPTVIGLALKLNKTNGVASGLTSATLPSVASDSVVRRDYIDPPAVTNVAAWGQFVMWGDSLVGDGASSVTNRIPAALARFSGMKFSDRGVGGETSTQIRARQTAAPETWVLPTIIRAGRNNYTSPTTVKADFAAMVTNLWSVGNTNRYLILSIPNNHDADERRGTTNYQILTNLNAELAATYGAHFVDDRSFLVSLYNPANTNDVADFANDVPPTSLSSDGLHWNSDGYLASAEYIYTNHWATGRGSWSDAVTAATLAQLLTQSPKLSGATLNGGTYIEAAAPGAGLAYFVGFIDDPATGAREMYRRNASQFISDLGITTGGGSAISVTANNGISASVTGGTNITLGLDTITPVAVTASATAPYVRLNETDAAPTNQLWGFEVDGNTLVIRARDGLGGAGDAITIVRSGATISSVAIGGSSVSVNGTFAAGSSATVAGAFAVDGTTLVVDPSNNRVGIGTASPSYSLDIPGGTISAATVRDGADKLVSSSGTTAQLFNGSGWTASSIYRVGTNVFDILSTGEAKIYGGLTVSGLSGLTVPTLNGYLKGNGSSKFTAASTIPISDIASLGSGVGTWLATPSSANLAAAITDETGTGALMFGTSPTVTGTLTATTAVAAPAFKDGSDTLLSSSGVTVIHALSSAWTGQNFYVGGTNALSLTKSGSTFLGPLTVSGPSLSLKSAQGGTFTHLGGYTGDPAAGGILYSATLANVKSWMSLNLVENTALSTWAGSSSITTVGTLAGGAVPATLLTGTIPAARLPAHTGDVTSSAGSAALTLATANGNVGTFGGAATVPLVVVDAKGRVTAATNVSIAISSGAVSGLSSVATSGSASDLGVGTLPDGRFPATLPVISGVNLTALNASQLTSGTLPAARLPSSGVTAGSYGNGSYSTTVTVDAYGRITAISTNAISGGGGSSSISAVFSGSTTEADYTGFNGSLAFTNGGTIIHVVSHGLTSGDVCWFQTNSSGVAQDAVYFATVVDADNFKISTSNAARLASTFVTATADGTCYARRWSNGSTPRIAPSGAKLTGIDGVARTWSDDGSYVVHFTSAAGDTNYQVSGSCQTLTAGTPLFFTISAAAVTTTSLIVQSSDVSGGLTDSPRVSVTIAP